MKKTGNAFILVFLFMFFVCSGCVTSHGISSDEKENTSSDESENGIGEASSSGINETRSAQDLPETRNQPSPYLYWEYELENVTPENILEGRSRIQDCISYSPDGKYVAVGEGSNLAVIDVPNKRLLWKKPLPGNVSDLTFSKDGKHLLVGERSPEGYIYSLDAGTGEEIHKYGTAEDLGTSTNPKHQPCVYRIKATEDAVYIAAGRYWKDSGYGLASRVYRFSPDGTLAWKLPKTENYARSVNWIDSSQDGKNVVYSTGDWTNSLEANAVIYSVDETGSLRWKYEIPPLRPYFVSAAIWNGLSVSEDGAMVTAYTGDGRKYLFYDSEMKKPGDGRSEWYSDEWQSNVTNPEKVEESVIYAYGKNAKIANENEILYLTGATLPAYYPNDVPMAHPLENSLVSCTVETGENTWSYPLGGRCSGIFPSPNMKFFVLPVGKDAATGSTRAHGVHVFDNQKAGNCYSRLLWVFNTEGVVVDADISSDCTVAAIEAPLQLKNGDVIGKHRLIIVR